MFEVGDVVCLRSGGPRMTVGAITDDSTVVCECFTNDEYRSFSFAEEQLDFAEDDIDGFYDEELDTWLEWEKEPTDTEETWFPWYGEKTNGLAN
jgi:uncharacterized protein YodC (DUF2158 family)